MTLASYTKHTELRLSDSFATKSDKGTGSSRRSLFSAQWILLDMAEPSYFRTRTMKGAGVEE
jgi:hypothetical protein